jgi:putative endonuclease
MVDASEYPSGWCCYLLLCADDSYYCGATSDLTRRIRDHFSGKDSGYPKRVKPFTLVWFESQPDRHHAAGREKQIKGWSREKKMRLAHPQHKWEQRAVVVSFN